MLISLSLIAVIFIGCNNETTPVSAPAPAPATTEAPATPAEPTENADNDTTLEAESNTIRIGYVCNFMSHEWYQNVTNGALRRAEELGVTLQVADANMDSAQQISFAENFMADGVDILALTPVDAPSLRQVVADAEAMGIMVITESNPVGGERTTVGADNKFAGHQAGYWMGNYALERGIQLRLLIVGYPNFEDCRLRVEGFKEGLEESGADFIVRQEIDSQGTMELALSAGTDALTANQDINAIFGINDDSTQGAIQAYRNIGLDPEELIAVGFGLEGVVGRTALLNNTPIRAELAMFPDFVGASIVDSAIALMNGETLPTRTITPTIMVTPETFRDFYTQDGDNWIMNFAAIEALRN